MKTNRLKTTILLAIILLIAASCNGDADVITTQPVDVVEPVSTATEFLAPPTETPVPAADIEAELVLWATETADPTLAQALEAQLTELALQQGLRFERHTTLSAPQLAETANIVVAMSSNMELQALAATLPHVRFVTVGMADATPTANITPVLQGAGSIEQGAFLAGYALALNTPDTRVGVISQSGTAEGTLTRDGFFTGAKYWCGLCNATFVPVLYYPFGAEIAAPADYQAGVDALLANAVTAMYIQPGLSSPELMSYLNANNITIIGMEGQAGLETAQSVMAVLTTDTGAEVLRVVERLLNGEVIEAYHFGYDLIRINEDLFSVGKQILFTRIREELLDGQIKPLPYNQ